MEHNGVKSNAEPVSSGLYCARGDILGKGGSITALIGFGVRLNNIGLGPSSDHCIPIPFMFRKTLEIALSIL